MNDFNFLAPSYTQVAAPPTPPSAAVPSAYPSQTVRQSPIDMGTYVERYNSDNTYQPSYVYGNFPEDSALAPTNAGNTVSGLLGATLPYPGATLHYMTSNRGTGFSLYDAMQNDLRTNPVRPSLSWMSGYTTYGPNPRTPSYAVPSPQNAQNPDTYDFYNDPYWLYNSARQYQLDESANPEYRRTVGTAYGDGNFSRWRDSYTQ